MSSAFADTHNMVAILTKSDTSKGFDQILDFLNCSYIKLQALVDKNKVLISEAVIRDVLRLDDAEGVDCLPNEDIFTGLARMGYEKPSTKLTFYKAFFSSQWKFLINTILQSLSDKRTSWNEFSSAMASAVICLSTGEIKEHGDEEEQDNVANDAQGADADVSGDDVQDYFIPSPAPPTPPPSPQAIPSPSHVHSPSPQPQSPTLTQSHGADFPMSLLQEALDVYDTIMEDVINQGRMIDELDRDEGVALMGEKEEEKKAEDVKVIYDDAQVEGRQAEIQAEIYQINMDHPSKVLSMHEEESNEVKEVVEMVTTAKLITKVVTAASTPVSAASIIIPAAETKVPTAAPVKVVAAFTRRRRGVVIRDPKEESTTITLADTKSKDKGKGIMVKELKPMKKKQQVKMDEAYARKLHEELNQGIDWDVTIEHVKQKAKEDLFIQRYQAKFNANMEFLLKSKEQIEEEENRTLESINETPAQKAAKRRRLNKEDKDMEEIKQHLEIVPDEDDDVYTEATPLARKV
nr:hypothetical protein [Tanacetum cinerariifolium]